MPKGMSYVRKEMKRRDVLVLQPVCATAFSLMLCSIRQHHLGQAQVSWSSTHDMSSSVDSVLVSVDDGFG